MAAVYLLFVSVKLPHFLQMLGGDDDGSAFAKISLERDRFHRKLEDSFISQASPEKSDFDGPRPVLRPLQHRFGRITGEIMRRWRDGSEEDLSEIENMANEAWVLGTKAWEEMEGVDVEVARNVTVSVGLEEDGKREFCPLSMAMSDEDMQVVGKGGEQLMFLPCGLAAGSSITIVATPQHGHQEYMPQLQKMMPVVSSMVTISQFVLELQGLKAVDGEDPPRILHLNPRLKGDWSKMPVIELNTCYRMQWGSAQRCDGLSSKDDDDKGLVYFHCQVFQILIISKIQNP